VTSDDGVGRAHAEGPHGDVAQADITQADVVQADDVQADITRADIARAGEPGPPRNARDVVAALLARDAASAALGIELLEAGPARGVVRMPVRADMLQGHGTCHGGLLFTLADTAFAVACNAGAAGPVVGASADITWVAPAFAGDVLRAEAVEHTRFGRNGITDVTVTRERDGAVVARFRGRSVELSSRPAPPAER
jgi:acyl-CoA thioesterase